MGNHRLTLAFPPIALSPQSSRSSNHKQLGSNQGDFRSRFCRNTDIRFQGISSEQVQSDVELLEMDLDDWLNADHFPPLSSARKNPTVVLGLPKHSQPDDPTRVNRLRHHKIPPIVVVDSRSITVGNLPIQFSWAGREPAGTREPECIRSTEQILQRMKPPLLEQRNASSVLKQGGGVPAGDPKIQESSQRLRKVKELGRPAMAHP